MVLSRIEKLKHLTCLCISVLPTNISKLKSLLVLCLGEDVEELPSSITELNQLIWLDVSKCCLGYLPKGLGNLSTLQVLKGFEPSFTKQRYCRFEELRKLTRLVTLEMKIESADQLSDGELDALSKLDFLRYLTLNCGNPDPRIHRAYQKKMDNLFVQKLDNLVLPKFLDEVKLVAYPGDVPPSWLCIEDLPYLRYLCFDGGNFKHFNKMFYEGRKWGIIHLKLNCIFEYGDWNVVRESLPYLKTLHCRDLDRVEEFSM